jgi:hypothetical protein
MINKGDGEEYYYLGLDNKSKYVYDGTRVSENNFANLAPACRHAGFNVFDFLTTR